MAPHSKSFLKGSRASKMLNLIFLRQTTQHPNTTINYIPQGEVYKNISSMSPKFSGPILLANICFRYFLPQYFRPNVCQKLFSIRFLEQDYSSFFIKNFWIKIVWVNISTCSLLLLLFPPLYFIDIARYSLREGFKNQINYFRGIFRQRGGEYPPSVKIINFFKCSENVQNALKHEIKQ